MRRMPSRGPTGASQGFAPVSGPGAAVLVLGSLPGRLSLERQQYYGQPRNAFWPILATLTGAAASASYDERLRRLVAVGIALWDVCAAAERPGSLDASIRADSVVPNDFAAFFARHSAIGLVCFNGATAAALYRRRVLGALPEGCRSLPQLILPSTSPAHAALSLEAKRLRWHAALVPRLTGAPHATRDAAKRPA